MGQKALFYEVIRSLRACPVWLAANALFDAIGGMIIVGIAFMVPRLISETFIEPSGGASLASSSTVSCDEIFKSQLVRQQAAGNATRMSQVKVQVQQRQALCASEVWDPHMLKRNQVLVAKTDPNKHEWTALTTAETPPVSCFDTARDDTSDAKRGTIAGLAVPRGLVRFTGRITPATAPSAANIGSGRDGENNIIVHFSSNNDFRASDGPNCWMYVERLGSWVSGFSAWNLAGVPVRVHERRKGRHRCCLFHLYSVLSAAGPRRQCRDFRCRRKRVPLSFPAWVRSLRR